MNRQQQRVSLLFGLLMISAALLGRASSLEAQALPEHGAGAAHPSDDGLVLTLGDVVFDVQEGARALCARAIVLQRPDLASVDDAVLRDHGAKLLALVEGGLLQWRIAARSPRPFDRDAWGRSLAAVADAFVASLSPGPSHLGVR